jgi:hypothetical protein
VKKFLVSHQRGLFIFGCMCLMFSAISLMTGCAAASVLNDIEAALNGATALIGAIATSISVYLKQQGATGAAGEVTSVTTEIEGVIQKVQVELGNIQDLVSEYKSTNDAVAGETLLQEIESGTQLVVSDVGKLLGDAGVPAALSAKITALGTLAVGLLNSFVSMIPLFKPSTAGTTVTVSKPQLANTIKSTVKAAING